VLGACRRVHALFPGVIVAVALGLGCSLAADYEGPRVGSIATSLPPVSLDLPWAELPSLLAAGAIIALIGFVEASSIARTFAARERARWDADREFVGQGLANVAAGLSGGFPVGGSFSRGALNRLAGARTRWSGAITGVAVLVFFPFASSLSELPLAVLSAIVIAAVVGLVRPCRSSASCSTRNHSFAVALATFALTLALAPRIDRAVIIGIGLAIAVHLWRELRLELVVWREDDMLHVRPRGALWFGTEGSLERGLLDALARNAAVRRLVVHLDGVGRIDITGGLALRQLLRDARVGGVEVEVADVRARWRPLVERVIEREDDPLGR
jgi:SulP family sulfate permease